MRGTRRPSCGLGGIALCCVLLAFGCSKSQNTQGTTATTPSSEETEPRSSRLSRAELACRLHSCAPPYYCNESSGVCELLPCTDSGDCPYGYKCDHAKKVCQ